MSAIEQLEAAVHDGRLRIVRFFEPGLPSWTRQNGTNRWKPTRLDWLVADALTDQRAGRCTER